LAEARRLTFKISGIISFHFFAKSGDAKPAIVNSLQILSRAGLVALTFAHFTYAAEKPLPPVLSQSTDAVTMIDTSSQAWEWGAQTLLSSEDSLRRLVESLDSLLGGPDEQTLSQSRTAWLSSHRQWLQLTPLLNLAHQEPRVFAELDRRRFDLDASNLAPGYLDALPQYPHSGIVNDIAVSITAESIRHQHALTDASEVSLGFHALELLLWGADGERNPADFRAHLQLDETRIEAGFTLEDLPNNRRRALLRLIGQMLLEDMQRLQRDWQNPDSMLSQDFYRQPETLRRGYLQASLQQALDVSRDDNRSPLNNFAGDRHYRYLAPLEGWEELLAYGDGALLEGLIANDQGQAWLAQMQLQVAALRNLNGPRERVTEDYFTQLALVAAPLKQLARDLGELAPVDRVTIEPEKVKITPQAPAPPGG
jgi:putative iron-regulated protein